MRQAYLSSDRNSKNIAKEAVIYSQHNTQWPPPSPSRSSYEGLNLTTEGKCDSPDKGEILNWRKHSEPGEEVTWPSVIRANLSAHNSLHIHIYLNKHCLGFELCFTLMDEPYIGLGWQK